MDFRVTQIKPFGAILEPTSPKTKIQQLDVGAIRELFQKHQLIVLRGFVAFESSQEFAAYCELWGEISLWPFGKVLELVEHESPQDHIFDSSYVPLHWDGMYRPQVPEYQIFHCVKAPLQGQGGRTTFSNTAMVLAGAPDDLRELWGKVSGVYKRKMEFYNSKTVAPLISKHPKRNFSVIRYNEPPSPEKGRFLNPTEMEFRGIPPIALDTFHRTLVQALYSPRNFYAHKWQDNDVVITDNFTLLHGREGFTSHSPRHLRRVQVLSDPPFNNPGLESYQ